MSDIDLSISELSALALKSARGSGFSWGLSEEAAMSVACLSRYNLSGAESLLLYIGSTHGSPPDISDTIWHPTKDTLCPLHAGTALSDFAPTLSFPLRLRSVSHPILLLPFAQQAAIQLDCTFNIEANDTIATITPTNIDSPPTFLQPIADEVIIRHHPRVSSTTNVSLQSRVVLPVSLYRRYELLSYETMVPISSESRSGAGAGDTDND